MKKLILLFYLILTVIKVNAGWYECYNYTGYIDKYPITLSIQIRDGFWGNKKAWNVLGVYKYDKQNTSITLEGIFDRKTNKVLLYEYDNNKTSAKMEFHFSKNESKGSWSSLISNKQFVLKLNFTSQLVDTLSESTFSNIEILQSSASPDKYFVGVYSKTKTDDRAKMSSLKIIDKKTNNIIQVLDFTKDDVAYGNVWTIIYGNVTVNGNYGFNIWADIGRMGEELYYRFNKVKNIYQKE